MSTAQTPRLLEIVAERSAAIFDLADGYAQALALHRNTRSEIVEAFQRALQAQVKAAVMQTELLITADERARLDKLAAGKRAAQQRRWGR